MARKIEIIFEFVYSFLVDRRKLNKNSAMSIQINTKIDKNLSFTDSMNSIPIGFQFCTCSNETERLQRYAVGGALVGYRLASAGE